MDNPNGSGRTGPGQKRRAEEDNAEDQARNVEEEKRRKTQFQPSGSQEELEGVAASSSNGDEGNRLEERIQVWMEANDKLMGRLHELEHELVAKQPDENHLKAAEAAKDDSGSMIDPGTENMDVVPFTPNNLTENGEGQRQELDDRVIQLFPQVSLQRKYYTHF